MITLKISKLKLTTTTRTMLLMLSCSSGNYAKSVSHKDITEAMPKG